jgi:hypothetical protein
METNRASLVQRSTLLLVLLALCADCKSRRRDEEAPMPDRMRRAPVVTDPSTAVVDGITYHLERARRAHSYESGALDETANAGQVLVVFDLTLRNAGPNERHFALDEAEFVAQDGHSFAADRRKSIGYLMSLQADLAHALGPAHSVRSGVLFEVPEAAATQGRLVIHGSIVGDESARGTIAVNAIAPVDVATPEGLQAPAAQTAAAMGSPSACESGNAPTLVVDGTSVSLAGARAQAIRNRADGSVSILMNTADGLVTLSVRNENGTDVGPGTYGGTDRERSFHAVASGTQAAAFLGATSSLTVTYSGPDQICGRIDAVNGGASLRGPFVATVRP